MMIRNIVSNWVALVVTAATSLLLIPILVHGLGHLHYGLWILTGSIVDSFALLDLGIRTTLQRFVARLRATGERQSLNEIFATGLALTAGICVLIVGATATLTFLPPHVFGLDDTTHAVFGWLIILYGATVTVTTLACFLGAYICGFQRFDLYNLGVITCMLARVAIIVAALRMGGGVLWVAIATLVSFVLMLALYGHFVRQLDPGLRFSPHLVKLQRARELFSFSVYVSLISAGDYIRTYSASVIIARGLGVAMITPFSIAMRLIETSRSIILGMIGPLMPRMSELHGNRLESDLRALTLRATRLTTLVASLMAWLLVLHGHELIHLWLGPGFDMSVELMLTLLIGAVLAQVQSPGAPLLIACGRHRAYASWSLAEALATVLLGVSLIGPYGLTGVAIAMIIPRIVVNTTIQPWYVLRVLGLPLTEYVKAALLRPLLVNAIFLAVCLVANRFAPAAGLGGFVWAVTGDSVVFLALAYAIGLTPSSRQDVRARSRQLAARLFVLAGVRSLPVEPIPTLPLSSVPSASDRPPGPRRPS